MKIPRGGEIWWETANTQFINEVNLVNTQFINATCCGEFLTAFN